MGTIREKKTRAGETRYLAIVRLKGSPDKTKTFRRRTDAKHWIAETEADLRRGRDFPEAEASKRTLADLLDRYRDSVLPSKAASTRASQRTQLQWWRRHYGHMLVKDVTAAVVAEAKDRLAETPKKRRPRGTEPNAPASKLSPSTVNRYLALLSHVFTMATKEWLWADRNPVAKVRRLKEPDGRVRALTSEELRRLLRACEASKAPWLVPFVTLALATSARRGALLELRWSDVDFARRLVTLRHTKTGEPRSVPLFGHSLETLKAWSKVRRLTDDRVFPSASNVSHVFARAVRRAGIEDFHLHDLRHTAITYLARAGATQAQLKAISGHRTVSMLARYSHVRPADEAVAAHVAALDETLFGDR